MSNIDAYRREQSRQTHLLRKALDQAVADTMKTFNAPIVNALAGALVAVQADMLASIPTRERKTLEKTMANALKKSLKTAKPMARTETVQVGGKTH
jgi:hypothetical protein